MLIHTFFILVMWGLSSATIEALCPGHTRISMFHQIWWHLWTSLLLLCVIPWFRSKCFLQFSFCSLLTFFGIIFSHTLSCSIQHTRFVLLSLSGDYPIAQTLVFLHTFSAFDRVVHKLQQLQKDRSKPLIKYELCNIDKPGNSIFWSFSIIHN